MRTKWLLLPGLVLASGLLLSAAGTDCTFLNNPDEYLANEERMHSMRSRLTALTDQISLAIADVLPSTSNGVEPSTMPRKNFIDDAIFNRMGTAGIKSAPLAS